jgi:cation-dependent mannose-6-phosphate receptor
MHFLSVTKILLLALILRARPSAAVPNDKKPKTDAPCTVHSPHSGSFFDLNPISIKPSKSGDKHTRDVRTESWLAKGYDYPVNFTINFCAPVVEPLKKVEGLDETEWPNVSAFYRDKGKIYSIG